MKNSRITNKAYRVLGFIWGLRNPAVVRALAPYGFSPEVLVEGGEYMQHFSNVCLSGTDPTVAVEERLTRRLDEFENQWFPIAKAALSRHHPALGEAFFANLSQSQGKGTTFGLMTFVSRLETLAEGEAPFGADGPVARALLAERGITAEVEAEAHALVEEVYSIAPEEKAASNNAERDEAEADLWAWYLEWSAVARAVIKDKATLRSLGFRKRSRAGSDEEDSSDDEQDAAPALSGDGASAGALPAASGTIDAEGEEVTAGADLPEESAVLPTVEDKEEFAAE
jgi:hypothetical protein